MAACSTSKPSTVGGDSLPQNNEMDNNFLVDTLRVSTTVSKPSVGGPARLAGSDAAGPAAVRECLENNVELCGLREAEMVIKVELMDKHGPGYDGVFTILGWIGEAFLWDVEHDGFLIFTFHPVEVHGVSWRNRRDYV